MKRRTFLAASSLAAVNLPVQSWGEETNRNIVFGENEAISTLDNREKRFKKAVKIGMVRIQGSLKDKFQLLKDLGFDGVELNSPNNYKLEEVLAAQKETGLPVHGVVDSRHWQKTLSHPEEAVRNEGLEALQTAIRDAKAYGASSVLLVPAVANTEATYKECWDRSIPMIKQAIPLAEKLEIDILLENVWNNFLTDPAETAKYIDELASDRVGAYYDTGNSVRYANPVVWIRTLGKRIKKLDIKEFDLALVKDDKWFDGFKAKLLEGTNGWYDIIRELKKIDFQGWGTAEIPGGGPERLKEIAERMDRIFAM